MSFEVDKHFAELGIKPIGTDPDHVIHELPAQESNCGSSTVYDEIMAQSGQRIEDNNRRARKLIESINTI